MKNLSGKSAKVAQVQAGEAATDWFVIQTNRAQERVVLDVLREKHFPAYCPMQLKRVHVAGHEAMTASPLFPQYVFAGLREDPLAWTQVFTMRSVRTVLMRGKVPAMISERTLRAIRQFEVRELADLDPSRLSVCPFKLGDELDVTVGGVAMRALFDERVDTKRIAVLLKGLFGRDSRVVVSLSDVIQSREIPK